MLRLNFLLILANQYLAVLINVEESCTCSQIKSKSDCANIGCRWDNDKCVQNDQIENEDTISVYCRSFDQATCPKMKGCAFVDNKCEQFSGCSAYIGSATDFCQQISQQCTSDGNVCQDPQNCGEYKNQIFCNQNINIQGGQCIWENNQCRDLRCNEASNELKTDQDCNKFKIGCFTNGKGCVEIRGQCSSYGTIDCNQMIGSDGYCVRTANGCGARQCQSAPSDYNSDEQCARYQFGCITTGKGCWMKPLPTCDSYVGNDCNWMTGSEGQCDNGSSNKCQSRKCENAPSTYNTDEKCKEYLSSCITNGRGCDTQLKLCSFYTGTSEECNQYIGSDGKCTQGTNGCKARVCEEAQLKTDRECNEYQQGCVTDGVNCLSSRKLCSAYNGTATTCSKYEGSDGRCYSKNTVEGICSNLVCTDAPSEYKTHEQCISFQGDCLSNGEGCVKKTDCISTIKEFTCKATASCQWNQICVTKTNCSNFTSISLCNNNLGNGQPCFWVNGVCRIRLCSDAPSSYTTNEQCKKFLTGCVTNSQGCLPSTVPCNQYQGTTETCMNFYGNGLKCTNTNNIKGPCEVLLCTHNTTATNQKQCNDFLSECKFQGSSGCIDKSADCNLYTGNQETCSQYFGINGTVKCYQDTGTTGPCRHLQCGDNITATANDQCISFLSTCVSKGLGCIDQAEPCSSYPGSNTSDCSKFKGLNSTKQCWWISGSSCVNKECAQNTTSTTNEQCEQFLSGCVTKGIGCIENTEPCTSFQGDETQCSNLIGNGYPCVRKSPCMNRSCSDVINPANNDQCTDYLSTCRFNGFVCIDAQISCSSYIGLNYQICQQITTISGGKCYLANGTGTCQTRSCTHLTIASNQSDCDQFLSGCIFSGSNCVAQQNLCSQYLNFQPNACEKAVSLSTGLCWRSSNSIGVCMARTCSSVTSVLNPYSFSSQFCTQYSDSCVYDGVKCVDKQSSCTSYTSFVQSACKTAVTLSGENCWLENGALTTCESRLCTDKVTSSNSINCQAHKSSCRYNGTPFCVDAQTACNLYTAFTQQACKDTVLADGVTKCWRTSNSVGTCEDRQCTNVTVATTTQKCLDHMSTCRFNGSSCVIQQANCNGYVGFTSEACKQVTTSSGGLCWIPGIGSTQCSDRTCSNTIDDASAISCPQHLVSCRYNGVDCVDHQATCNLYTGFTKAACQSTTTIGGSPCWKQTNDIGTCEDRSCSNIIENPNYVNCGNHLSTCTYDGQQCYIVQISCNLYVGVSEIQCQNLRTTTGDRCWFVSGNCIQRTCSQNQSGMTDLECDSFLPGCRTNGKGCVDASQTCSQYRGTSSSCMTFVGNSIKCKGQDSFGYCEQKQCYDNTNSVTDIQCDAFMKGCVTRGLGCIDKNDPCNNYVGNQLTCSKFVGNGKNCWNDSTSTISQCRVRLCSDNQSYNADSQCQEFQAGCVTKGRGCIVQTAKCSDYQGTQIECSQYKGSNGTKPCWNDIAATPLMNCVQRNCQHNTTAKTDKECNQFLSGCVTKGIGCVLPQPCSLFNGTTKSCPLFSATDKPCKGQSNNSVAPCAALKCDEAPNNYDSDELCNIFKEGCVTNGYGCVSSVSCEDIQTQQACQKKSQCLYTGNCTQLSTKCSVFQSQSVCVNTPVYTTIGRCQWELNKTSNNGYCRDWKCEDASESVLTHEDCQRLSNQCTSKGKGCTPIGACSSYTTSISCSSAKTTDEGGLCIWEKTYCRKLDCNDASKEFSTDAKCQEFLRKCFSNGKGCVNQNYTCKDIVVKPKCTKDYAENVCLWFQQSCIAYSQCTDIQSSSHTLCQQYSNKCTSNGQTCIPISQCSKYLNQTSCSLGIDGECGWINNTCAPFKKCSDFNAITTELCQSYSNQCISDGQGCISKTECNYYQTETSCLSGGTDGFCIWAEESCRQRKCTDATANMGIDITSYTSCNSFVATTKCTTNGTNCIPIGLCSSYKEAGCHYGTDGNCVYGFQEGQTQGIKSCRVKSCSDYQDTTTEVCKQNKKVCISNGSNCIIKNKCQTYKTKTACNSGGLDGICVFTPSVADPQKGICTLMTTCEQANSDLVACKSKQNSCHFQASLQNGIEVTSCINHTCGTVANGSICKPVFSFDEKSITVCVMTSSGCSSGSPNQLSASNCLEQSLNTYSWNAETNLCQKCNTTTITPPPPTNTTDTNTDTFTRMLLFSIFIFIQ